MADDSLDDGLSGDEEIIAEAKKRFRHCEEWESEFRVLYVQDLKFADADPDNGWQWDSTMVAERDGLRKPSLTINKTRQHNLQIINDAKQNKPGVNVRPVGDGASYDAAQVFEGVVRHIEYQSNAEVAYDTATTFQVKAGIGYWRVITDYATNDSFDQEIFIRRIKDPTTVYLDPDISEVDGSDAAFGFVFEDVPAKEFAAKYPDFESVSGNVALDHVSDSNNWNSKEYVRVAEYYRKMQKKDRLVTFSDPTTGAQIIKRESELPPILKEAFKQVKDEGTTQTRDIVDDEIEWYKIVGDQIVDRREWPGKYIPIVRVIGEETIIEGKLDRKGHTRAMKDPQRMYNYWTSEATAQVALQTKTPYIAPAEAIEGQETYWKALNVDDFAVLPYNQYTEDGRELARPQREQPPIMSSAYVKGMEIAQNEMMMASGQYQSQFGQNENATSGKAINERQRQGDNATYHFIDNLAIAIRFTGKILIDLIPKVYDTPRIIRILAKDGSESHVQLDPMAGQAYTPQPGQTQQQPKDNTQQIVEAIFNPNVGRYEVESDIGPAYATRRQEAWNAFQQLASANKEFMQIGGDIMFKAADFPMADELAERYRRTISPNILGDAPPPQDQQMMAKIQQMQGIIAKQAQELADKAKELDIKQQDAITRRLTAEGNAGPIISPEQIRPLIMQTIIQALQGASGGQQGGLPMPPEPSPAQPPQAPAGGAPQAQQPEMAQ